MQNKITILLFFMIFFQSLWAVEIVPTSYTFDQATGVGSYTYHDETGRQLIDGYYGTAPWSANLGNGNAYEWVGWVNKPTVNIDFDFTTAKLINQINIGTVQDHPGDVVIPSIYIYSSTNKSTWNLVTSRSIPESTAYDNTYQTISFTGLSISTRYIRVSARFSSDGPWTFLDEADFYQTAAPALTVSNTNFGNVRVGSSGNATVTVTNTGNAGTTLTGNIGAASGSEFSPVTGSQSFSLAQNQQATRTYTYSPSARGTDSTVVSVTSNATNGTATLTATGVSPVYSSNVAPGNTIDFGVVDKDVTTTRGLTIQNTTPDADLGDLTDLTILSATISGVDAAYYSIENFIPGTRLSKNATTGLTIRVTNNDHLVDTRNAVLTIVTDANAALGTTGNIYTYNLTAYLVPEPSSYIFLSIAGILFCFSRLHRKSHNY